MNEVLEFIERRFTVDSNWTTGNCYYFAVILKERFAGEIYYDTIEGHFCTKIGESFWDFHGDCHPDDPEAVIKWDDFDKYDHLQYNRIIRDCLI